MKQTVKNIPKTAAGFEKDYNALKNDQASLLAYLKQVPPKTVEALFKKAEVPTEVLSGILKTIAEKAEDFDAAVFSGIFLLSLAKANNFEMTLMFAESKDLKNIDVIVDKISKTDSRLAKQVKEAYTPE